MSEPIRIRLEAEDFACLVRGGLVARTRDGQRVLIALADIGYERMNEAIADAVAAGVSRRAREEPH